MTTDVTSTVAHTRDCKIPGCTDTAAATAGAYALLCTKHAEEKRRTGPPRQSPASTSTGGGLHG